MGPLSALYDYSLLALSLVLVVLETVATAVALLIPRPVFNAIGRGLRFLVPRSADEKRLLADAALAARVAAVSDALSFVDICSLHGFRATEHVVTTPDGYLLGIHRIEPPSATRKSKIVYLHHGLLMNSEIWVASPSAERSVAIQLAAAGYEVWLGNNRGNKYSKKHVSYKPMSREFWNFCLDEFAMYDIPSTVDYILRYTRQASLTYIGFSQGSAQAFAALSIHPELNDKINLFIALGPAMAPPSLGPRFLQTLMRASPSLLFTLFGHRVILRSTVFWQSIMLPDFFIRMIDLSNKLLFKWTSDHISWAQKRTGYAHLYSYTSVKTVVHWFQIIARNNGIHMYDDDTFSVLGSAFGIPVSKFYHVPPYPTQNITTPIEIIYGTRDTLVDIDSLLGKLPPPQGVLAVEGYEHLEMIWGEAVPTVILPHILRVLEGVPLSHMPSREASREPLSRASSISYYPHVPNHFPHPGHSVSFANVNFQGSPVHVAPHHLHSQGHHSSHPHAAPHAEPHAAQAGPHYGSSLHPQTLPPVPASPNPPAPLSGLVAAPSSSVSSTATYASSISSRQIGWSPGGSPGSKGPAAVAESYREMRC